MPTGKYGFPLGDDPEVVAAREAQAKARADHERLLQDTTTRIDPIVRDVLQEYSLSKGWGQLIIREARRGLDDQLVGLPGSKLPPEPPCIVLSYEPNEKMWDVSRHVKKTYFSSGGVVGDDHYEARERRTVHESVLLIKVVGGPLIAQLKVEGEAYINKSRTGSWQVRKPADTMLIKVLAEQTGLLIA